MTYTSLMTPKAIPISVSWLKAHLSEVLLRVSKGDVFTIMNRKIPIAKLVNHVDNKKNGIEYSYMAKGPFKMPKFSPKPDLKLPPGFDVVDILLEDRRKR